MLQPNTTTPSTHRPMHQMYPPMHPAVPVPVPVPHAPLPDQLPQAAAHPAQMQAMVPMQAGLGHGLPPLAMVPRPMATMTAMTPLPPPHMQMVSPHPCASNHTTGAALKRPLDVMHVRPLSRHHRHRHRAPPAAAAAALALALALALASPP